MKLHPNLILYKVYKIINKNELEFVTYIQAKDGVVSDVAWSIVELSSCTFDFKTRELYDYYSALLTEYELVFERMMYEEGELTIPGNYNPLFFMNYDGITMSTAEEDNKYRIMGYQWDGFFEDRKIAEHTIFYDELPIEPDTGQAYEPTDFNMIKYKGKTFREIMEDTYERNILNPVTRAKGITPTGIDPLRRIGILGTITWEWDSVFIYNTIQEKKSIHKFKALYRDYAKSYSNYDMFVTNCKINNGKVDLYFSRQRDISISNLFNHDTPSLYKSVTDATRYYNSVLAESQEIDLDSVEESRLDTKDTTTYETIIEASNEDGDTTSMEGLVLSKLSEFDTKTLSTIDILFKNREYYKEFTAGDTITLTDFESRINGRYLINTIREIIEGDMITYSLEEIERMDVMANQGLVKLTNVNNIVVPTTLTRMQYTSVDQMIPNGIIAGSSNGFTILKACSISINMKVQIDKSFTTQMGTYHVEVQQNGIAAKGNIEIQDIDQSTNGMSTYHVIIDLVGSIGDVITLWHKNTNTGSLNLANDGNNPSINLTAYVVEL